MAEKEVEALLAKYRERLREELAEGDGTSPVTTREYNEFKKELLPDHLNLYETLCNWSEKLIKIEPKKEKLAELKQSIDICHLNMTPYGATSFAMVLPIFFMVIMGALAWLFLNDEFFIFIVVAIGLALIPIAGKLPYFLANSWRLKASNQMVIAVFYLVTYMRHTSNLEKAVDFASEHLTGPLALDFKKILWDTENEKFSSVKEGLDTYLESWRGWNPEFIESIHLIISSLYEGSESRRLDLLDKGLDVMLEETYEKMLHYAQNLKSPITMLHMLGIILPILGLVILPLVVAFMEGVRWYHLMMLYNVLLPVGVYYLGKNILSQRPTGYGDTDISQENPEFRKFRNFIINLGGKEILISPFYIALIVGIGLFFLGMYPLILHGLQPEYEFGFGQWFLLQDYQETETGLRGPYGLGAAFLSLFIPLAAGIGWGISYKLRSKNLIKMRQDTKKLESEFSSALFQLGNRLGDGMPAEIAIARVAESSQGTTAGKFFELASRNIHSLGMSVHNAIFDRKVGALVSYPSKIIESSMKVMSEASKKGTKVAAQAVINISRYIKEMHRVDERLKDILEEIISSMQSQIKFLTPVIAGIVIGITSMITTIILRLNEQMQNLRSDTDIGGNVNAITDLFGKGIPTYYFQIIVGIYVVQIIAIMTILVNGIQNGDDKLNERFQLGKNLFNSTILYVIVAFMIMLIFNVIAGQIMNLST
ncbi:MAG: hypothetical protein ABIH34_01070 [Nanoarchaeota archaeon]